jgi:hypothetical protein
VESPSDMSVGILVVFTDIDENYARCKQTFKFAEIDFWD